MHLLNVFTHLCENRKGALIRSDVMAEITVDFLVGGSWGKLNYLIS